MHNITAHERTSVKSEAAVRPSNCNTPIMQFRTNKSLRTILISGNLRWFLTETRRRLFGLLLYSKCRVGFDYKLNIGMILYSLFK
jgi:hypothetical protein